MFIPYQALMKLNILRIGLASCVFLTALSNYSIAQTENTNAILMEGISGIVESAGREVIRNGIPGLDFEIKTDSITATKYIYPVIFATGIVKVDVEDSVITLAFIVRLNFQAGKAFVEEFNFLKPAMAKSVAADISGDPFVTGYSDDGGDSPFQAFVYDTETESFRDLGAFSEIGFSFGTGVNVDGTVITGSATLAADGESAGLDILHAFRWTESTGLVDLGSLAGPTETSRAFDISGDGSIIVGETRLLSGVIHAFRWTEQDGFEDLGAVGTGRSVASAITFDGNVIVGSSGNAIRWTGETGMVDLGAPNDASNSIATGVSNNGSIVVGSYDNTRLDMNTDGTAEFSDTSRPFRWTDVNQGGHGMMDLEELLELQGVDLTGITLISADGVSEDGQFIFGKMQLDDAQFFEPLPYIVQYCDGFVDFCDTLDSSDWPTRYNGVIPHESLGLELNNISALNPQDGLIYSCLNILSNGQQSEYAGIPTYDIAFEVVSLEQGLIRVANARPFNANLVLNELGELPDCSGAIDLATGIYTDIIQAGLDAYSVSFELIDGVNLQLQALEVNLIGTSL